MKHLNTGRSMAEENFGIITKVAYHYWHSLPPYITSHVDLEDLVEDIVLQVIRVSAKYDKKRGLPSTFVWSIAKTQCLLLLQKYTSKMRNAVTVGIEDCGWTFGVDDSFIRYEEAKYGVEKIIKLSSDDLRRALSCMIEEHRICGFTRAVRRELVVLSKRHGVSMEDYRIVLGGV